LKLSAKVSEHRKKAESVSNELEKIRKKKDKNVKKKISQKEKEWLKKYEKSLKTGKPMKIKGGKKVKVKKDKEVFKMIRKYEMYINFEVSQYIPVWKNPLVEPTTYEDYHPEFIFIVDEMENIKRKKENEKYDAKLRRHQTEAEERYDEKIKGKIKEYDLDFDDIDSVCKFLDKVDKWRKDNNQNKRLKKMGFKFGTSGLYISTERLVVNLEKNLKNIKKTDKLINKWMETYKDDLPESVRAQFKKMSDKMESRLLDAYTDIHHFKCSAGDTSKKSKKRTVDMMNKLGIPAVDYEVIDLKDLED
jgi:hypothetical protein